MRNYYDSMIKIINIGSVDFLVYEEKKSLYVYKC